MSGRSVEISTKRQAYERLYDGNTTNGTLNIKVPLLEAVQPVGDGIIEVTGSLIQVLFYGQDADDETFNAAIWGWSPLTEGSPEPEQWIPDYIGEVAVILSTTVGAAGTKITAADRFADTITLTTGDAQVLFVQSNAVQKVASLLIDATGHTKIEIEIDISGTALNANALWRAL